MSEAQGFACNLSGWMPRYLSRATLARTLLQWVFSSTEGNMMRCRTVLFVLSLTVATTGCSDPSGPLPDDVQAFVRAEGLPKVRTIREVFALDTVRMYRISYGEPQDCPSGCFYLGGTLLKVGSRIGWIGLDSWNIQFDSVRRAYLPEARDNSRFHVVDADTVLVSPHLLQKLLTSDIHHYLTLRTYLGVYEQTPEPVLWLSVTRAVSAVNPAALWLILTHPNTQCSRRILEHLAEFRSPALTFREIRAQASELLDTLSVRCSGPSE